MRRLGSMLAAATLGLLAANAEAQATGGQAPAGQPTCPGHAGMHGQACTCPGCPMAQGGQGCPMMQVGEVADVTVEDTANGAVVRFQAKSDKPADVKAARQAAQQVGQMLEKGCPMKQGKAAKQGS